MRAAVPSRAESPHPDNSVQAIGHLIVWMGSGGSLIPRRASPRCPPAAAALCARDVRAGQCGRVGHPHPANGFASPAGYTGRVSQDGCRLLACGQVLSCFWARGEERMRVHGAVCVGWFEQAGARASRPFLGAPRRAAGCWVVRRLPFFCVGVCFFVADSRPLRGWGLRAGRVPVGVEADCIGAPLFFCAFLCWVLTR